MTLSFNTFWTIPFLFVLTVYFLPLNLKVIFLPLITLPLILTLAFNVSFLADFLTVILLAVKTFFYCNYILNTFTVVCGCYCVFFRNLCDFNFCNSVVVCYSSICFAIDCEFDGCTGTDLSAVWSHNFYWEIWFSAIVHTYVLIVYDFGIVPYGVDFKADCPVFLGNVFKAFALSTYQTHSCKVVQSWVCRIW